MLACRSADTAIREGVRAHWRSRQTNRAEVRAGRDRYGIAARNVFACEVAIWALLDLRRAISRR